jgi:hypothetical protein
MKPTAAWILLLLVAVFGTYHYSSQDGYRSGLEAGLEAERLARTRKNVANSLPLPGLTGEVSDVLLLPDPILRMERLASLLGRLDASSLEQVREAYRGVVFERGDLELVLFAEWWARFDPEGAFDWTRHRWETSLPWVSTAVVRAWARIDPQAAYRAAGPLTGEDQPFAPDVTAVVIGWAESGKPGLDEFIARLPAGHQARATTVALRRRIRRDGPEASIAWAESAPLEAKLRIYQRMASGLAESYPQAATAFAEKHMNGDFGKRLPRRVATRWAKSNPVAAMEWLSTIAPGQNRDDAVTETYRRWLGRDPTRAKAWLEENVRASDQRWLEPAMSLYAHEISLDAPAEAAAWAQEMVHDPELRVAAIANPVRSWLLQDEAAARDWVARESGLSEKFQQKVLVIPDGFRFNFDRYMEQKAKRQAEQN